ncbi:MAG: hypothetical protein DBY32_08125 [Phascolarctobacterium sp.]|nr:MAG: hypothetical protein DBY32_08125 [Phascolarctobacterium sp.]
MQKAIIKKHNFDDAKNRIKEFSKQVPAEIEINTVRWNGDSFFGELFDTDHNVTGSEFNNRIRVIQEHLRNLNANNIKAIQEFNEVYKAFDLLDKEYINAILINMKGLEETSDVIAKEQEKINRIINHQQEVIQILKIFKEKIDAFKIADIKKAVCDDKGNFLNISANLDYIYKTLEIYNKKINELLAVLPKLPKCKHLKDIDEIWKRSEENINQIKKLKMDISEIINQFESNEKKQASRNLKFEETINDINVSINSLNEALKKQFRKLNDTIQKNETEQISNIFKLKEEIDNINSSIKQDKQDFDNVINNIQKEHNITLQKLQNKLRNLTIITGGALALSLVTLMMLFQR